MSAYYGDDGDLGERMEADMMQADLEAAGRREARLRRLGICTHGWTQERVPGVYGWGNAPMGAVRCLENGCGGLWKTRELWSEARAAALRVDAATLEAKAKQARALKVYTDAAERARNEGHSITLWKKGAKLGSDKSVTATAPGDADHRWCFAIVAPDGAWTGPCADKVREAIVAREEVHP